MQTDQLFISALIKDNHPEIDDHVWSGPDTVIYGQKIGCGVVVAEARRSVGKSVPARCLIAGKPGRIIKRDIDLILPCQPRPPYFTPADAKGR